MIHLHLVTLNIITCSDRGLSSDKTSGGGFEQYDIRLTGGRRTDEDKTFSVKLIRSICLSQSERHNVSASLIFPQCTSQCCKGEKISIIGVGFSHRWRGVRLDGLPAFRAATHSNARSPVLSTSATPNNHYLPPISVPLRVSTAVNIIREVSASAPHSGKSNLPPPIPGALLLIQTGGTGRKY